MSVEEKIDSLTSLMQRIDCRLSKLEGASINPSHISDHEPDENCHIPARHGQNLPATQGQERVVSPAGAVGGPTVPDTADFIQEEYATLKDSLQRIKLPQDQRLNDSRAGVNRAEQPIYNVVVKCARYIETALKWTGVQEPYSSSAEDLVQLHTILLANMRYLQCEYQAIIVQSQFDKDTSKFFRSLQKDNSTFSDSALRNLRAAVEVSAIRGRMHTSDNTRRGYYSNRGRGYRGGGPRNYGPRDSFHQFSQRGVSRSPGANQDDGTQ